MVHPLITQDHIDQFQRDGVVLIRGLFADQVEILRDGVEANMAHPGPYASNNEKAGQTGRFFDDYCNWTRIPQFEQAIKKSPVAEVAADLMQSSRVQMFHDHVLVKEPGTSMATPWHQDGPYYFTEGKQTVSFWSPLDPVTDASLRCVAGSHRWEKEVVPTRWVSEENFFADEGQYMPVPDPDAEGMTIREWDMQPGDAVAFHYRTLHGARANTSETRRRAFSLRLVGDDARYIERPGPTSPPYHGHEMVPGQILREDWFPVLYQR
ncbi:phytanoyl-CoA dioxygenase family protein [Phaeobacter porticola]|uniref:Putative phytanoyl-CoA dioxygenase n=1 Tax=Phaeobacter porticola TaxID=1844006 RepID=A0A1L3I879_9RHOB|nr:phytanoyl-CoA dioxygenase family protein [Phaeobacter porticola]APG48261.1 putative phytanoyl-CoA dioxygenase [Phaeobacter porticola]